MSRFLDILFAFLVFLLPIILKSYREGKKMKQSRDRKTSAPPIREISRKEIQPKKEKSLYEPIVDDLVTKVEDFDYRRKRTQFGKITKEEFLKGIVLTEILSEPKCMKNLRNKTY